MQYRGADMPRNGAAGASRRGSTYGITVICQLLGSFNATFMRVAPM